MKFHTVVRAAAAALVTGALLVPGISPAKAAVPYPPHVSVLYASPFLVDGYASITVLGTDLTSDLTVTASRGTKSKVASVNVDSSGTIGTALIRMSKYLLSTTAGRYTVDFALEGSSVEGVITSSQTYTVGKAITITNFNVQGKSYGLYISGKAAKYVPVKLTITFGSKVYKKSLKASKYGNFSYRFRKTSDGLYTVTAQVGSNKKYFSDLVTETYTRT